MSNYRSQSARDAEQSGYGGPSYWQYLDDAAAEKAAYYERKGEPGRAAEQFSRSLSDALRGNDGL